MDLRYGLGKIRNTLEPHNYIILLLRSCTQIYSFISFNPRYPFYLLALFYRLMARTMRCRGGLQSSRMRRLMVSLKMTTWLMEKKTVTQWYFIVTCIDIYTPNVLYISYKPFCPTIFSTPLCSSRRIFQGEIMRRRMQRNSKDDNQWSWWHRG